MRNKWERDATYVTNQLIGKRAKKSPNLEQERERSVYTQHGRRHDKERHQTLTTHTAGRIPHPPKDYSG